MTGWTTLPGSGSKICRGPGPTGEVLCILKHNKEDVADSIQLAQSAFQIGPVKTGGEKHILAVIR